MFFLTAFKNFESLLRYRPNCEVKWNLIKTLKFIKNCKVLREFTIANDMGIQKKLNILWKCLFIVVSILYTSITWIQNVYPVKISLCSTYVNEIWMKYLKNYLSGDYDCIGQYDCRVKFCFIEYLIICLMQPKKEMIHIQP